MKPCQCQHTAKVHLELREYLVIYNIIGEVSDEFQRAYVNFLDILSILSEGIEVPKHFILVAGLRAKLWQLPVDDYLYESYLKAADDATNPSGA